MSSMKEIEVVAAIIFEGKHVLCVQRAPSIYAYTSLKYEFPGGKVEPTETEKEALEREILEELSMSIIVGSKYHTVKHAYPDFSIVMHSYLCIATDRDLVLHEHVTAQWLEIKDFKQLDWAEADVPIVEKLMEEKT
jgi:8-oxo-dGTP diphosphatase